MLDESLRGGSAAKEKWDADKCSKHVRNRLKGKMGAKRPIPITRVKSLATWYLRVKCGHAPTGVNLKRFGHQEYDTCWWCGGPMGEHLLYHGSRWRDQHKTKWKLVGKVMGWKVGRCRHVLISELFPIKEWDKAVMDFLAATQVGKFMPKGMMPCRRF